MDDDGGREVDDNAYDGSAEEEEEEEEEDENPLLSSLSASSSSSISKRDFKVLAALYAITIKPPILEKKQRKRKRAIYDASISVKYGVLGV